MDLSHDVLESEAGAEVYLHCGGVYDNIFELGQGDMETGGVGHAITIRDAGGRMRIIEPGGRPNPFLPSEADPA